VKDEGGIGEEEEIDGELEQSSCAKKLAKSVRKRNGRKLVLLTPNPESALKRAGSEEWKGDDPPAEAGGKSEHAEAR